MRASLDDLRALDEILDQSYRSAGEHIRSVFTNAARLSASEIVEALDGIFEMHLATTTADGAPIVAPIDACFFRGKVWFGLPAGSVRSRLVRKDPRISASYTRGKSFGFILHGVAREVGTSDPAYEAYSAYVRDLYVGTHGPHWITWYLRNREKIEGGYHAWIEPRRMYVKK